MNDKTKKGRRRLVCVRKRDMREVGEEKRGGNKEAGDAK